MNLLQSPEFSLSRPSKFKPEKEKKIFALMVFPKKKRSTLWPNLKFSSRERPWLMSPPTNAVFTGQHVPLN